jgi:hypothetical protein
MLWEKYTNTVNIISINNLTDSNKLKITKLLLNSLDNDSILSITKSYYLDFYMKTFNIYQI